MSSPRTLEHDPDPKGRVGAKWKPVFPRDKRGTRLRGDHAQTKRWDHDAIPLNRIMIQDPDAAALLLARRETALKSTGVGDYGPLRSQGGPVMW